jgi:FMN phosphatase YigB (HAD superfamily)
MLVRWRRVGAFRAVLFDFGHTLFEPTDISRRCEEFRQGSGVELDDRRVQAVWEATRQQSRRPEELAKGRDLSAQAHRRCWLELLAPMDVLAVGLAEFIYDFECSVAAWQPYPDSYGVLSELRRRGVAVGVISDTGWDIRPVFAAHDLERLVAGFDLSHEHGICKPDRRIFEAACARLEVLPDSTLMVGDSPLTDGGAADVGIATLILPARDRRLAPALEQVLALAH